jgi:hypothetical protein
MPRSENDYIFNDILPFLHSNYNFPIHDSTRVKINSVPIFSPSGGRTASTIDIVYYQNGVPLLLVEAKTKHKTHESALKQALIYLKNFPYDKPEFSANGKKPKYIATSVGTEIQFYKWSIDYEKADFIAESTELITFDKLLVEYGLSKGYKDFFDELIDIFTSRDKRITPKIISLASEQILSYLSDNEKYYGQKPYIDLSLQKQKAVRDIFNKYDFNKSIGPEIAKEYRKIIVRAFQGGGLNQYLTDSCVIDFMVDLLGGISKNSKVLDFECGSGGYLASILSKDKLSLKNIKGIDIAELPYVVSKTYIALFFKLKGRDKIDKIPIKQDNGLYYHGNIWDIVIGNPAGNKNYRQGNLRKIIKQGLKKISSLKGNCSEYELSIQQALRSVKIGGKICLLLTESFFSNSTDDNLRKFVVENVKVNAIISLPRGIFKVGTSTSSSSQGAKKASMKMSILFAEKVKTKQIRSTKINFKKLDYPVFLASIRETKYKNEDTSIWLSPKLDIIKEKWKNWNS